jgi:predicted nucleic acid-binding protein
VRLLDTNVASDFIHRDARIRSPVLHAFVDAVRVQEGLAVSMVTRYEMRRGFQKLVGQAGREREGRRKLVVVEKFLGSVDVLGLDPGGGAGWDVAANLWAAAANLKPARALGEADLMVAATAVLHSRTLVSRDKPAAETLKLLGVPVELIELS